MAYQFIGGLLFFLFWYNYGFLFPKSLMFWFGGSFMILLIGVQGLLKNSDIIKINELKEKLDEQLGEKE